VQFKNDGTVQLFDLGSGHGTFLNKERIEAKKYYRLRVGSVVKFGASTRLFILQGPEEAPAEQPKRLMQKLATASAAKSAETFRSHVETEVTWWACTLNGVSTARN
jgi:pSer/pThr/pTyr-binding forkhead associated (FHA) protein